MHQLLLHYLRSLAYLGHLHKRLLLSITKLKPKNHQHEPTLVIHFAGISPFASCSREIVGDNILYFDALTLEKAEATIKYTLDESELPPPPPPV